MRFEATEGQIKQIAANAVNASFPMGLGFLHFRPKRVFQASDFDAQPNGCFYLDYVQGRMVKLSIFKREDGWEIDDNPRADYQSWVRKYPTTEALVNSVLEPMNDSNETTTQKETTNA